MKLTIKNRQLAFSPEQFLRKAGYGFIEDRRRGKQSFVRRLGGGFYPRLHMYVEREGDSVSFNLHLDQKQASYSGSHMHNAEYGGTIVESEMERIKGLLRQETPGSAGVRPGANSQTGTQNNKIAYDKKEDGWWKKIFN